MLNGLFLFFFNFRKRPISIKIYFSRPVGLTLVCILTATCFLSAPISEREILNPRSILALISLSLGLMLFSLCYSLLWYRMIVRRLFIGVRYARTNVLQTPAPSFPRRCSRCFNRTFVYYSENYSF